MTPRQVHATNPAGGSSSAPLPSRRASLVILVVGTLLYAAALIANLTAGAMTGIMVGMFVSLAISNTRDLWRRHVLLLLAAGSWALVTLLVQAYCLHAAGAVCAFHPLLVSWLPSLFYVLCWLAWTLSLAADRGKY